MSIDELNQEQLEELRERYFYELADLGEEEFETPDEIPMSNIKAKYEGTYFVPDDFWCSMG